ncbi:MAG: anaerobic ribonucleoside-triphosphate reductase activating protein [Lachnoclostridium sp.]|jgi:anaerobic ribonucleoside-triphosphate reductase activating protein|nr:anaerobic ribonucleoside-triphosphate reductase activating protein [Lachnoclostridium sp.]
MNYADIKQYDVANGVGVRVSLFVSGCSHHCKGCFNEEAWDFDYGEPFTEIQVQQIIDYLKPNYVEGLSLLGGEPFEPQNRKEIVTLLRRVKKEFPNKSVWCFTGYLYDKDIMESMYKEDEIVREIISYLDVLVDGRFVEEKKNLQLTFRGSSNQRVIKVKESLDKEEIVLWEQRDSYGSQTE